MTFNDVNIDTEGWVEREKNVVLSVFITIVITDLTVSLGPFL